MAAVVQSGRNTFSVAVVIVAGGRGSRMGGEMNKVFLPLGDSCILGQTLALWQEISQVSQIIVVCGSGEEAQVEELCRERQITKAAKPIAGGRERQHSVWQGLLYLESQTPPPDVVVIHDGARPFYDGSAFSELLQTVADGAAGIVPAVPVQDTIKAVAEGRVTATVPRENLVAVQTPQLFRFPLLFRCYERLMGEEMLCTDDASVLEQYGCTVAVYPGQKENLKITTPEDYDYGCYLWAKRSKEAVKCE